MQVNCRSQRHTAHNVRSSGVHVVVLVGYAALPVLLGQYSRLPFGGETAIYQEPQGPRHE